MTILLFFFSFKTPYDIAFNSLNPNLLSKGIDYFIDVVFVFDILFTFNTAYYNDGIVIVHDRKNIGLKYLKGWFLIDFISCIPFAEIISASSQF